MADPTQIGAGTQRTPDPANGAAAALLLVIGRVGGRAVGLPSAAVERILRMAALTPLPDAPPGIAGLLNLHGALLPVVDPRPRLGLPLVPWAPDQHLVVMAAAGRFLLWLDRVERIVTVAPHELDRVTTGAAGPFVLWAARIDGEVVPVLSPEALDPGPVVQRAGG
ncbi:MAG: chemotaxis protein CheW [Chloroflexi bacterium]|nr:chemotaxis protein CheW [Chloroflexota bacterium]